MRLNAVVLAVLALAVLVLVGTSVYDTLYPTRCSDSTVVVGTTITTTEHCHR